MCIDACALSASNRIRYKIEVAERSPFVFFFRSSGRRPNRFVLYLHAVMLGLGVYACGDRPTSFTNLVEIA